MLAIFLIVGLIAETVFYSNEINGLNGQISDKNSRIHDLEGQVSTLKDEVTNLTTAKLVTALGTTEVQAAHGIDFNKLFVEGSVNNTGAGTAYHAGLRVVAYADNGTILVNMTVPLAFMALFGTDTQTQDVAHGFYSSTRTTDLGNLLTTQTAQIHIGIFHQGNATSWAVTPVWSNSP